MVKTIRIAFVLGFALSLGMATSQELPPRPSLPYSAVGEVDFRACDRDWNHVNDFWTPNIEDLYRLSEAAGSEESPD